MGRDQRQSRIARLRLVTPGRLKPAARFAHHAVARFVPRLREWEYVPDGWALARSDRRLTGWDVVGAVEAYRAKLPVFRAALAGSGPLAFETSASVVAPKPTIDGQNVALSFAYALLLAGREADRVSVLDWGGGIGLHYHLAREILPAGVELEYHCKELPLVCAYGRDAVPEIHFHEDEQCLNDRYDLVLASSSLQYSEGWSDVLGRLAVAADRYLFLTRVPVVVRSPSFVVRQRGDFYGLGTEYLSWVLNRDELLDCVSRAGLELAREFLLGVKPHVWGAPEQDETRAFLFRATRRP